MNYAIDQLMRAAEDAEHERESHAEELAEITAERDEARADLARLRAEHAAALATARREGAEGMRAAAVDHCRRVERAAGEALGDVGRDLVRMYVGRRDGAGDCAYAIAALPLDAPGGAS
jgi:chromosome segregation ATPase